MGRVGFSNTVWCGFSIRFGVGDIVCSRLEFIYLELEIIVDGFVFEGGFGYVLGFFYRFFEFCR